MVRAGKNSSQQKGQPKRRKAVLSDAATGKARKPAPARWSALDAELSRWYHSQPGPVFDSAIKAKATEVFPEIYQDQPLPKFGPAWLRRWKRQHAPRPDPPLPASAQEAVAGGQETNESTTDPNVAPAPPATETIRSFDSGTTIPDTPTRALLDAMSQQTVEETESVGLWLGQTFVNSSPLGHENQGNHSTALGDSVLNTWALEEHDFPMPASMQVNYYWQRVPSLNFPDQNDNESLASTQIIDE